MRKAAIVTGFVPIPDHPRPVSVYEESMQRLRALEYPLCIFQHSVEDCWLWQHIQWSGKIPEHAVADNPKKNTLAYHCVQHQKASWVVTGLSCLEADVVVYIDVGIFTVPGVTEDAIKQVMSRVHNERVVTIPGCWEKPFGQPAISQDYPCWRFCGGLWSVPRSWAMKLEAAFRFAAIDQLEHTGRVEWEVNTLARIEAAEMLPISWYKADHNETMFTNYPEPKVLQ